MQTKTVLITGAAQRIGAAVATHLHALGMKMVIHHHRSAGAAQALCRDLNAQRPGSAKAIGADLREAGTLSDLVTQACEFLGGLDVLINNASAFYRTSVGATTESQWDDLMGTNLKAPYFLAQHAAPHLKASHGAIVNLADIHAERPLRGYGVYSISKAGLVMLTRVLAKELGPEVRVNAVAPGAVLWPEDMEAALRDRILSHTILKRGGSPDDIARAVRFLIEDADYMTGQVLTVDGGRTLYS